MSEFTAEVAYTEDELAFSASGVKITQGEQRFLSFRVKDHAGQPVDLTAFDGYGIHLPGSSGAAIKRTTYPFLVGPSQVRVGDSSLVLMYDGHGLLGGDLLSFDENAPQVWRDASSRRQCWASVLDRSSFYPADWTMALIYPSAQATGGGPWPFTQPFGVSAPLDLGLDDLGRGVITLHVRSAISLALLAGTGLDMEVRLKQGSELKIVPLPGQLDVAAGLNA